MIKNIPLMFSLLVCYSTYSQTIGSFKDQRDGKVYNTVVIGAQTWMSENLNVTKFNNGDIIKEVQTDEEWKLALESRIPACRIINGDKTKSRIYNWFAVNDSRGLAPNGWIIPTDQDWKILLDYLGGKDYAGPTLRNKTGWNSFETGGGTMACPNCLNWNSEYRSKTPCHKCQDNRRITQPKVMTSGNGNNSSGFSAIPHNGESCVWWSSTEHNENMAWSYSMRYNLGTGVFRDFYHKGVGYHVRCVKIK
jgi:uncharacterized protein (TIGR02145 family)